MVSNVSTGPYFENFIPDAKVFRGRVDGKCLGHKGSAFMNGWVMGGKDIPEFTFLTICPMLHGNTARRFQCLDLQPPRLQNYVKINALSLCHQICAVLLCYSSRNGPRHRICRWM